ncbi:MAG TPA: hypothetical protein VGM37_16770 [Armatimonadota bacterium]|jgi:hypothetical protein
MRSIALALLGSAVLAAGAHARTKTVVTTEIVYAPAVAVVPEVRTPAGELRVYKTPAGITYWRNGLPVYMGDSVKLNVFVSTGGADLAETRVRLDNVEKNRRTEAPWNAVIETGALEAGYHYVEAWARTGGADPQAATAGIVFFVDPKASEQGGVASPVVADVPPPAGAPAPSIDPGSGGPSVQISADLPDVQNALDAGVRAPIHGPVTFAVSGPAPTESFVYALYRNTQQVRRSDPLPLATKVKLRPDAPDAPGLQSGILRFVVWGADKQGRLGPPKIIEIEVAK